MEETENPVLPMLQKRSPSENLPPDDALDQGPMFTRSRFG
jgi:hypothetical protein